ncbi:MAG: head-tail adaptor protein [Pseudomonadota bacterium]
MKLPQLNRSLVLEGPLRLADGSGGFTEGWEALGVIWAEVRAMSGRERAQSAATLARTPFKITLRAAPHGAASRPTAGQRFRDGNRIFVIHAVAEQGPENRYLTCNAVEEVAP